MNIFLVEKKSKNKFPFLTIQTMKQKKAPRWFNNVNLLSQLNHNKFMSRAVKNGTFPPTIKHSRDLTNFFSEFHLTNISVELKRTPKSPCKENLPRKIAAAMSACFEVVLNQRWPLPRKIGSKFFRSEFDRKFPSASALHCSKESGASVLHNKYIPQPESRLSIMTRQLKGNSLVNYWIVVDLMNII